jgi:hypothetical protein
MPVFTNDAAGQTKGVGAVGAGAGIAVAVASAVGKPETAKLDSESTTPFDALTE